MNEEDLFRLENAAVHVMVSECMSVCVCVCVCVFKVEAWFKHSF